MVARVKVLLLGRLKRGALSIHIAMPHRTSPALSTGGPQLHYQVPIRQQRYKVQQPHAQRPLGGSPVRYTIPPGACTNVQCRLISSRGKELPVTAAAVRPAAIDVLHHIRFNSIPRHTTQDICVPICHVMVRPAMSVQIRNSAVRTMLSLHTKEISKLRLLKHPIICNCETPGYQMSCLGTHDSNTIHDIQLVQNV